MDIVLSMVATTFLHLLCYEKVKERLELGKLFPFAVLPLLVEGFLVVVKPLELGDVLINRRNFGWQH